MSVHGIQSIDRDYILHCMIDYLEILKYSTIKLGRNETEEENNNNNTFIPPYDEFIALRICQILLKRGASPNGNTIYDMRPLHIAVRREWTQVARVLLEAGW